MEAGANFSDCRKLRYSLWRIWDQSKPLVMFIGLNPSTANETESDPTINSVVRIAKANGYGGAYMMNCFPFISTNPKGLEISFESTRRNDSELYEIMSKCKDAVFAWGNFEVVRDHGRDIQLSRMFPNALCLARNKNGTPKHPLYCKSDTILQPYNQNK
ncbi:MAG TPA: DUF1643 domain-containing protein [Saprospiraceae bacterium]|nr:DUF1643 domain-containing protein [Saprospiraceae bacterium]